jgi:signal transduction histidine kinase
MNEKRNKERLKTGKLLFRQTLALTMALWFGAMALLTWAVAEDMCIQIEKQVHEYASGIRNREMDMTYPDDLPGTMEASIIRRLGVPYYFINFKQILPIVLPHIPNEMSSDDWFWGKWDLLYGFEPASLYYDRQAESVFTSGSYLTFAYTSDENWAAGNTDILGLSYINLNEIPNGIEVFGNLVGTFPYGAQGIDYFLPLLRLEGYFEGNQFHPVSIDRGSSVDLAKASIEQMCGMDNYNKFAWHNMLSVESAPDQPTEIIYAWDVDGILGDYEPLTVNWTTFDGLPELLEAHVLSDVSYEKDSLLESIIIRNNISCKDRFGSFDYAIAVRFWPLQYAVLRLIPLYLVSFALVFIVVKLILRRWRKCLVEPLAYLAVAAEDGYIYASSSIDEIYRLETYAADIHRKQAEMQNEIQQLRTALDYAKDAEEKRRQLISNITHELKTPLAVIHSYAEGLQSGIDAEKQEHYLSVILDESEYMDEMVLQMLDVSRLEAGKVRLSVDHFSLLQLTESVVEKFAPLLEEKELSFRYGLAEEFELTADEGRMRQVITNLISNALKYTSRSGRITVNISVENHSARFTIANTAKHLSDEALLKVWDSFYRADPSRTEPGTGLGLTLVKSIVELHRGVCYVRNTVDKTEETVETAVEFGFTLPIK